MALLDNLKSKKWLLLAGGVVVASALWVISRPARSPVPVKPQKPQLQESKERLYDLKTAPWQSRVEQDLDAAKKQMAETEKNQEEIRETLKDLRNRLSDLAKREELRSVPETKVEEVPEPIRHGEKGLGAGIAVHRFGQPAGTEPKPQPRPVDSGRSSGKVAYLPGGSMARSVLLTGVDAPVGGKPFPVLLALSEGFSAPNSFRVLLKGCFALGKAEGNASSERADIQVFRISCVLGQGKAFEQEVSGYLVAEDGKQGVPGKLVEKQGQKIALAALSGIGAGLARAFGQQEVTNVVTESGAITSTVTGDALRFGVAEGARGAADEIRRYLEKQAERLVPVVEVEAGRKVTLIMLSGLKVPGLGDRVTHNVRSGID